MDYVFGAEGEIEVLKTKGREHTDMTGYQQVERIYPDQTITDSFRVVRKIDSKEDEAGNCYDWYEIDHHFRTSDKTGPVQTQAEINAMHIDYISMMTGVDLPDETEEEG